MENSTNIIWIGAHVFFCKLFYKALIKLLIKTPIILKFEFISLVNCDDACRLSIAPRKKLDISLLLILPKNSKGKMQSNTNPATGQS